VTDPDPALGAVSLARALESPLSLVADHARMLRSRAEPGDFMLRARLDEIIDAAARMKELLEAATSPPSSAPAEAAGPPAPKSDRLLEDLRREFPDPSFVAELVDTWIETALRRAGELRTAADARDRDALVRHAHALVAPAKTVGAFGLADLAAGIERDAPDGSWDRLLARVDEVEALVPATVARLRGQI